MPSKDLCQCLVVGSFGASSVYLPGCIFVLEWVGVSPPTSKLRTCSHHLEPCRRLDDAVQSFETHFFNDACHDVVLFLCGDDGDDNHYRHRGIITTTAIEHRACFFLCGGFLPLWIRREPTA